MNELDKWVKNLPGLTAELKADNDAAEAIFIELPRRGEEPNRVGHRTSCSCAHCVADFKQWLGGK